MKKGILIFIISALALGLLWAKIPVIGEKYNVPPYQPTETAVLDEGFEGGALPTGWTTEYVNGTIDWTYVAGGQYGNPGGAHTGSYNALFYGGSYTAYATNLISPAMDISATPNPVLNFWLANDDWAGDQDILNVYYRDALTAPWTLLATYDYDLPDWTEQEIDLPAASADYYVCFEGVSGYGYGVCIDDVIVDEGIIPFIQVGDGTLTGEYIPIEPYYGYTYSNVIYLASEINTSGDVSALQYQYQSTAGFGDPDDIVIYMGHTTQASFVDGSDWIDVTTMTEVFNGALTFPPAAGEWITITLDTPFTYNGADNLVIAWDENTTGYHSGSDDFYCTATTDVRSLSYYSDSINPDPTAPPTTTHLQSSYANVRFNGLVPTNPPFAPTNPIPADLAVDINEATDLNWDGMASAFYVYLWDDVTETMIVDGEVTMDAFYDIPGNLDFGTLYHWRIDAENVVGTTTGTEWAFTTRPMPTMYTIPYSETFDTDVLPAEWIIDPVVSGDSWEFWLAGPGHPSSSVLPGDHTGNGGYFMGVDDSSPETVPSHLYSPYFDLTGATNPYITFWYWIGDTSTASTLNIDVNDGTTVTVDVLVAEATIDHWEQGFVNLVPWIGQNIIVDFRAMESTSFYGDICLDDVELLNIPAGDLNGYVYEFGTTNPIENAEIVLGSYTGTTDATGYYEILDIIVDVYDATASYPGYFDETVSVTIVDATVTTQDFYLGWAEILVDPMVVNEYVDPGATMDVVFTVTNNGPFDLAYNPGLNFISDQITKTQYRGYTGPVSPSIYAESTIATNDVPRKTINNSDAVWDLQFAYDVDTPSGLTGIAGAETDGTYLYGTKWSGTVGEIVKFNLDGTFVETFTIPGVSGLRDLAYDGTYFYGSDASSYIWEMDFDTQTLISTITTPTSVRSIAYDSDLDGFWYNNFSSDLIFVDRTGTQQNTIVAPPSMYGCAYDNLTAGGPYLWIFTGTSSGGGCQAEQYDLNTLTLTAETHSIDGDLGAGAYIAGGMFLQPDLIAGTYTLGGLAQGTPDLLFGYELGVTETWLSITDPGPGVVTPGGTAQFTATLDATDQVNGDVRTGEIVVNNNAITVDPVVVSVTINVGTTPEVPEVIFSDYIEGSSNNKALEIWNNTGDVINLDDYRIAQSVNGGGWAYWHIFPVGATVADGDVWVMLNADTDVTLFDPANADEVLTYPSVVHHNGDDARGLEWTPDGGTTWTLIDIIGDPDVDPGYGWDVAGVTEATKDHTLVRKDAIMTGNTDWLASAGTNTTDSEWIVYPQNTFDYLGSHGSPAPELDPPSNLFVTDEGYATWNAPPVTIFSDDFEAYSPGDHLAAVSTDWTTWSNLPGSAEDGVISDAYALSPTNSLLISGTNDQVLIMDNYTSGVYSMELNLYVPTGNSGYWNLQKTNTIGEEWAFQILFETDGTATADAGAAAALTFAYAQDTWINMKLVIDLDADWCDIYVDDVLMHGYQWTLGTFGTPGLLSLGGMNLYASGGSPMCYFDDFTFSELSSDTRDLLGYNTYIDGVQQNTATVTDLFYLYEYLVNGTEYLAEVTAVYDEGESDPIDYTFTYVSAVTLDPPSNLFVTDEGYATWDAPSGGGAEALYSQMDFVSSEGGVTSQDFETSFDGYDAEGADDFVVPVGETWTINEVAILGSFSVAGPCDLANVRFFEDAAGMPGTLLFEYLDVPANFDADGNFDCSFDDTILAEGTYWIGVQARLDYAVGGQWFWTKQAAPTIDAEFHWQNPLDGFGSGFTTWVAGSIQWPSPDYVDFNLSFALFGSLAEGDKVIVKSNNNRIDVSDNVYVTKMDSRMLEKEPQLTGARSSSGALYSRDLIGYNTYLDGVQQNTATVTDLFYLYEGLVNGTEYLAEVTAVYDEGESAPIDYTFTYSSGGGVYTLPFDEDFEGGAVPTDWTMTTNSIGWFVSLDGSSTYWTIPAGDGYYACSNDDAAGSGGDGSMDYLTTPELDLTDATGTTLTFDSYYTGEYSQLAMVEASTDGTTWTIVNTLTPSTSGVWDNMFVDLSAYDGESSVWFTFHADDAGAWASGWAVDNVTIAEAGGNPIITVTPTTISEVLEPDESVVVPVTIQNTGGSDLTFDITIAETDDTIDRSRKPFARVHTTVTPRVMTPNRTMEYSPMETHVTGNVTDEIWDVQGTFRPVDTSGGIVSQAGMEFDGTYFYCPIWNSGDILKYDIDGNYVETFSVAGVSGTRDLAYDGEYMYGGSSGAQIYCWDPVTYTLITTITSSAGAYRAIAYDSDNDGFLGNNWDGQIVCTARDGSTIYVIPDTGIASVYGMAYDNASAGGPFLWLFSQSGSGAEIHQVDIASGLATGVMHDVLSDFPSTGIAGGLWVSPDYMPGTVTIGGLVQGEDAFMYELCAGDEPWISVAPLTGTVAPGTTETVDVTLDATDLASGTIKLADIVIANNAGEDVIVDVTMEVDSGPVFVDPPTNVAVDDELGIVSWYPPANTLIFEDFEAYSVGDHLAEVSTNWTTWSNAPGTAEDGVISDDYALSPTNSLFIEGTNDQVLIMDNYTSGIYSMGLNLYIPTGNSGYWNLQKTNTIGEEWAFQILFQTDGVATADAGAAAALVFNYDFDTWINMELVVDLNDDWCDIYVDDALVFGYQWTLGTFGTPGLLSLGGMNLFASGNVPACYFDDIRLTEIVPATDELLGYNVYLDGTMQNTGVVTDLEYTYAGLVEDETYMAGVSAVYDEGESDIVEVEFTYNPDYNFFPPNNPAAVVEDYNDVLVTWELPGGAVEEISHHSGYNANGIGTGAPADFICAARFTADELSAYYGGWSITGVNIFLHSLDFSYVGVQVYEGGSFGDPGTLVYEEDVTSVAVAGEFTPHLLSTPVPLLAGNEYWLAYDIQATGDHPAAVDIGPMVTGKGAWMYFGGAWQELLDLGATLNFNWVITGLVSESDAVASKGNKRTELIGRTHKINSRDTFEAEFAGDIRRNTTQQSDSRSLAGYTVYKDGVEIADIPDPAILSYLDECLDAGTYEYTIEAYYTSPDGVSDPTDPVSATVVLDVPINVVALSLPPNIMVTWAAPTRGIDSYNVYRDGVMISEGETGTSYINLNVPTGEYTYNVTAVYCGGWESEFSADADIIHVDANGIFKPTVTELTGNYPNPFNPTTKISFSLKEAGHVSIDIYNMRGQLVKTLVNTELDRDFHEILWNGKDNSGKNTSSGVYFYKMKASNYTATKKMILMK